MTTQFDPEAGLLRVRHAALAVLARLAADPTDTRLHDHDVAPLIAELRGAGLLGRSGIAPDVEPIAAAIGQAGTVGELTSTDHGTRRRMRVWVGNELVVAGVEAADAPHTYELMADARAAAVPMLAELVGLGVAAEPGVAGSRRVGACALDALLAAQHAVEAADVAAALGASADEEWAIALTDGLRGSALRWRLTAWRGGAVVCDTEVLDAGRSGLWLADREGDAAEVRAATPDEVRERLARLA